MVLALAPCCQPVVVAAVVVAVPSVAAAAVVVAVPSVVAAVQAAQPPSGVDLLRPKAAQASSAKALATRLTDEGPLLPAWGAGVPLPPA